MRGLSDEAFHAEPSIARLQPVQEADIAHGGHVRAGDLRSTFNLVELGRRGVLRTRFDGTGRSRYISAGCAPAASGAAARRAKRPSWPVSTSPEGRPRKLKLAPVKGFRKREIARGAKLGWPPEQRL